MQVLLSYGFDWKNYIDDRQSEALFETELVIRRWYKYKYFQMF